MHKPHIHLTHTLWKDHLHPGDTAIDATCGNGHDALAIAELISGSPKGELHCIDLQISALENTSERLKEHNLLVNSHMHHQSHETLPNCEPNLIVYNLGYLPGSDKKVKTGASSTISSVKLAIDKLKPGGLITITCYPGHLEGEEEEKALLAHLKGANYPIKIGYTQWFNRDRHPSVVIIYK